VFDPFYARGAAKARDSGSPWCGRSPAGTGRGALRATERARQLFHRGSAGALEAEDIRGGLMIRIRPKLSVEHT